MATYMFCGLSGPVDLFSSSPRGHGLLPPDSDYAALLISFVGEGLVFHVHSHGRAPLDVTVHELLVYAIMAQAACLAVEMARRSSVVAALARGFCAVLQVSARGGSSYSNTTQLHQNTCAMTSSDM
ncbi:hypothetical protein HPB51_023222 [Rhipicephalus microplus]|uniref:Uncharacterized protein n=1 Tax=Rhipicephalus microplus TaxID=6941 RepID=A0A9J6EDL2_RHIMP|nr:hypothetical protein HPB51_023222 [Rhipicephalus microplus]